MWEGPVSSIRTSDKTIMKDGLCFVAHEVFLQHFNYNGYFTFYVDIKKADRVTNAATLKTKLNDINNNDIISTEIMTTTSTMVRSRRNSEHSLYDSRILRLEEQANDEIHPILPDPVEDNFGFK